MEYAIVSLSPNKGKKLAEKVTSGAELRVLFDEYAPHVWIVSYKGTLGQLTDLLWPDDDLKKDYEVLPAGLVIKLKGRNISGYAASELWETLKDISDGTD